MAFEFAALTAGLNPTWVGFLRDWDRTLRAGNHPETTRYNYLLAAAQLARYLSAGTCELDTSDAAGDPVAVEKGQVEEFQIWMVQTRSAATALNKHKGLQQFFRWLVEEEELDQSPMARVRQPKTPQTLVPIIRDDDTKKILDGSKGGQFADLRDEAIIRLLYNTGGRLSEVANLRIHDADLDGDWVRYRGKGAKDRRVRFGPKTGRALSRYLRARARHPGSATRRCGWRIAAAGRCPRTA